MLVKMTLQFYRIKCYFVYLSENKNLKSQNLCFCWNLYFILITWFVSSMYCPMGDIMKIFCCFDHKLNSLQLE